MGPRAGLDGCGKSRPYTGIRSPDRPARSESLYRLSYRGPQYFRGCIVKKKVVWIMRYIVQMINIKISRSVILRVINRDARFWLGVVFKLCSAEPRPFQRLLSGVLQEHLFSNPIGENNFGIFKSHLFVLLPTFEHKWRRVISNCKLPEVHFFLFLTNVLNILCTFI